MLIRNGLRWSFRALIGMSFLVGLPTSGEGGVNDAPVQQGNIAMDAEGQTLAHYVHMKGYIQESALRDSARRTQKMCIQAKEMGGKALEKEPLFPIEEQMLVDVEDELYYTEHAKITYTAIRHWLFNQDTCDVTVPRDPGIVRVEVRDGKGACTYVVSNTTKKNKRGNAPVYCSLSRKGYRAPMYPVDQTTLNHTKAVGEDVAQDCLVLEGAERKCIRLLDDNWTSYHLYQTDWAGITVESIAARGNQFDDKDAIINYRQADRVETNVMISNDIIYPHLFKSWAKNVILIEDEGYMDGDDEEDARFDDQIDSVGQ